MRLITRYKQLSGGERRPFFRAFILIIAIRFALLALPYSLTRGLVKGVRKRGQSACELDRRSISQVSWAVEASSHHIPGATCLIQAIATQLLLRRLGQASELHLGVARNAEGDFEAHAWIEAQGRIIQGGAIEGFHRYCQLRSVTECERHPRT
jgi:hypothetical protein